MRSKGKAELESLSQDLLRKLGKEDYADQPELDPRRKARLRRRRPTGRAQGCRGWARSGAWPGVLGGQGVPSPGHFGEGLSHKGGVPRTELRDTDLVTEARAAVLRSTAAENRTQPVRFHVRGIKGLWARL